MTVGDVAADLGQVRGSGVLGGAETVREETFAALDGARHGQTVVFFSLPVILDAARFQVQ